MRRILNDVTKAATRWTVSFFVSAVGLASFVLAQAPPIGQTPRRPQPGVVGQPAGRGNSPASSRTSVIRGRVVAGDTGLPIRQAQVSLTGPPSAFPPGERGAVVVTDEQGRYEMAGLPAGRLMLAASKAINLKLGTAF